MLYFQIDYTSFATIRSNFPSDLLYRIRSIQRLKIKSTNSHVILCTCVLWLQKKIYKRKMTKKKLNKSSKRCYPTKILPPEHNENDDDSDKDII